MRASGYRSVLGRMTVLLGVLALAALAGCGDDNRQRRRPR
jgi:hypothetical protein